MWIKSRRSAAAMLVAALALTSLDIGAVSAAVGKEPAGTFDLSARRHWHRGNSAALGAAIGVFGAIAALAAADRYRNGYYYGNVYDSPYAYGGPYAYGPAYRYRHWHHHDHWR